MEFVPTRVTIGGMQINNADHSSNVSFGATHTVNKNVSAKKNQGFGQQLADRAIRFATVHMVLDDDLSDVFTVKINA